MTNDNFLQSSYKIISDWSIFENKEAQTARLGLHHLTSVRILFHGLLSVSGHEDLRHMF